MLIDSYKFGRIIINGKEYNSDVIIYPDKVNDSWRRIEGHNLVIDDIQEIIKYRPDTLIIGKGTPGLMKVSKQVQEKISSLGIKVFVFSTSNAIKKYNEINSVEKVVAALHLTC